MTKKPKEPNLDDMLTALEAAYLLLVSFQQTIDNSLEGDHPMADDVDRWLTAYEKVKK